MLLSHVPLEDEEVASAVGMGLRVRAVGTRSSFVLPCSALVSRKCSVYESRPRVCAGYRCLLLREVDRGEVTLDEALVVVEQLHGAVALVADRLGAIPDAAAIAALQQEELQAPNAQEFRLRHSAVLLALGRLERVKRRFVRPARPA